MSLIHSAIRAGIFDRAMDVCEDAVQKVDLQIRTGAAQKVDLQIRTGAAQIRAYRLWKRRGRGR